MSTKLGFGIVEIVVALGLFAVLGVTGTTLVLHSFTANRLGLEQTQANNLASSGIDIIRNIRTQNFSNLVNGTYGLNNTSGIWSLTTTPETWDKFTRTITISDALRDGGGNLADTGTVDPNTKKLTSTVNWNFGALRNNSVVLVDYLTNFAKNITNVGDAIIAWGDTTTTPKWSIYSNSTNSFGTKSNLLTGESARNIVIKTSPTKSEAILGYTSSTGVLHVLCYNGSSWSEDWSVTVGGTGTTKRFDIGYETNSGDAMVVYSTNTATTNELAYRTKLGSSGCGSANWDTITTLNPVRTSGIIHWVKLAEDPGSNQNVLGLTWADAASDLSAMLWNGSAWVNEPSTTTETNLERVSISQDVDDFDLTFESLSGNLMIVWANAAGANGTNGVRYRRCIGGTAYCAWGAVTTPPTFADDATNLDISSNPASNEIVFASIGNAASDLQVGYWSGSAWTNTANRDTSARLPSAGTQYVATGWLTSGATTRSIVAYDDSGATNIGWYVGNNGVFTLQSDFVVTPVFVDPHRWYGIAQNPKSRDQLMFTISDNNNDLFAKRLVMTATPTFTWTNSDGGAAIEANLSQSTVSPFSFAYWRNP